MSLGETDVLLAVEHVHARSFDGELVVLDLKGGEYYALNDVGLRIWERLVAGDTILQAARAIEQDYKVDAAEALTDCITLAEELLVRGLLRRADAAGR